MVIVRLLLAPYYAVLWLVRWVPKEKPWLWRPHVRIIHRWQWYFSILPVPFIDWSDDGAYDFEAFGLAYYFGPWIIKFAIEDND